MSAVQVKVPTLGESVSEATIAAWKRAEGDPVKADEPLVEVESEKATVEVPSPGSGVLTRILRKSGDTVAIGEVIAEIDTEAALPASGDGSGRAPVPGATRPPEAPSGPLRAPDSPPPGTTPPAVGSGAQAPSLAPEPAPGGNGASSHEVKASPALRRLMAENDLAPGDVQPSGPAGRVQREDILKAVEVRARPAPVSAPAPLTPVAPPRAVPGKPQRVVPMSPLRRTVARRLLEAQQNAAILTTFNEINMAEVIGLRERYQEQFQKRHGIKLGFMSFFVKATVDALKAYPIVNAEVRGTDIIYKDYYDIGIAVGGGRGLVVPVVRNADRLSLAEMERGIAELAGKAKENKLRPEELEGGTFTISNGGIYGSMLSTPILNPPQSGILGLHAIQKRPVAVGEAIALRPMMFVALSYDHRVVDGREAVQFLVRVKECIEDPERILIEV
jgi:2-oxoglutarate dehydrogenase E2 component (dihydrolipoamide succinyltransferase)